MVSLKEAYPWLFKEPFVYRPACDLVSAYPGGDMDYTVERNCKDGRCKELIARR